MKFFVGVLITLRLLSIRSSVLRSPIQVSDQSNVCADLLDNVNLLDQLLQSLYLERDSVGIGTLELVVALVDLLWVKEVGQAWGKWTSFFTDAQGGLLLLKFEDS